MNKIESLNICLPEWTSEILKFIILINKRERINNKKNRYF